MDVQRVKDQLTKIESKTEPWFDRVFTKLVESRWTGRIVVASILVLLLVVWAL